MTRSLFAILIVTFSLVSSVAAQDGGTVTGTGKFSIDGALVQSGAKILNNSTLLTDADGDVVVDLGALGKMIVRPNTSVKFGLAANNYQLLISRCGSGSFTVPQGVTLQLVFEESKRSQISVKQGEITIESLNQKKTLTAGHKGDFYTTKSITTNPAKGETSFTFNCCQCCFVEKSNP